VRKVLLNPVEKIFSIDWIVSGIHHLNLINLIWIELSLSGSIEVFTGSLFNSIEPLIRLLTTYLSHVNLATARFYYEVKPYQWP